MKTYEQRLNANTDWASLEGSMHFEKDRAVHKALRKIARRLDELGIPFEARVGHDQSRTTSRLG
jgi:hypothetical protein